MFQNTSEKILNRMRVLEKIDEHDRLDGTPMLQRLRQIPQESGRFIAILAAAAPPGKIIEIGTSAGYSTLWLSLAAQRRNDRVHTFELLENKYKLAKDTFQSAGVEEWVDLVHGNALAFIPDFEEIAFCFLDAEKDIYLDCYEQLVPRMVSGGILLADNVISHQSDLQGFIDRAMNDPRVDSIIVPVGKGILLSRKQ